MTTRQKVESLLPDLVTQKNWAKIAELTEQYELEVRKNYLEAGSHSRIRNCFDSRSLIRA